MFGIIHDMLLKRIMVFKLIENITSKMLNLNYQNLKFAALAPVRMSHCYMTENALDWLLIEQKNVTRAKRTSQTVMII